MVNILREQLEEKFPLFGPNNAAQVTDYMGIERLHVSMYSVLKKHLEEKTELKIDIAQIKELADVIFDDIDHRTYLWNDDETKKILIDFQINSPEEYINKYDHHTIEVYTNSNTPILTYQLANRGTAALHDRQRKKYLQFAVELEKLLLKD